MTDDLATRVDRLRSDATHVLESARSAPDEPVRVDDLDDSRREEVRDLAAEAADLLESTDPEPLLDAIGMGGADGPGSIPEAILTGEADAVAELRALLVLSRLAPEPDRDASAAFDDNEREALTTLTDLLGDEPDESSAADDSAVESTAEDTLADESDAITSTLQTVLEDVKSGFGDVLDDESSADDGGLLDRDEDSDGGILGGEHDLLGGDGEDEESETEDEGVLEVGDGDGFLGESGSADDRESVSGYGRSTYSTVPAQDRPDMKGVRRYSTMAHR